MLTDPIADMISRIKNAITSKAEKVDVPASKIKLEIIKILKEEGFIKAYKILKDEKQGILRVSLKYADGGSVITGMRRISKPGRRVYVGSENVPRVMNGVGIAILTTPKGILNDNACRRDNVGGEVICYVW